uniref:Uncharacterized protein n=1 Tax=Chromera velia CCMP2878 TaxID=1169474 RepID=A0A0G4HMF4_9ALVE|eukprot:Cvel_7495.t1-p1 / transcript=Cvel_7495.t1 / gene=Cvel_7495 / organism=Chromera_velia_CCMP2878 / gene_product=hypothetical protein / transcript_product=hypothetical protein / location=Cvel_scaffold393:48031-59110(+) / protein_length=1873 / sequence_SO=supercontig / SO=protein_coding / is_pseudo=false
MKAGAQLLGSLLWLLALSFWGTVSAQFVRQHQRLSSKRSDLVNAKSDSCFVLRSASAQVFATHALLKLYQQVFDEYQQQSKGFTGPDAADTLGMHAEQVEQLRELSDLVSLGLEKGVKQTCTVSSEELVEATAELNLISEKALTQNHEQRFSLLRKFWVPVRGRFRLLQQSDALYRDGVRFRSSSFGRERGSSGEYEGGMGARYLESLPDPADLERQFSRAHEGDAADPSNEAYRTRFLEFGRLFRRALGRIASRRTASRVIGVLILQAAALAGNMLFSQSTYDKIATKNPTLILLGWQMITTAQSLDAVLAAQEKRDNAALFWSKAMSLGASLLDVALQVRELLRPSRTFRRAAGEISEIIGRVNRTSALLLDALDDEGRSRVNRRKRRKGWAGFKEGARESWNALTRSGPVNWGLVDRLVSVLNNRRGGGGSKAAGATRTRTKTRPSSPPTASFGEGAGTDQAALESEIVALVNAGRRRLSTAWQTLSLMRVTLRAASVALRLYHKDGLRRRADREGAEVEVSLRSAANREAAETSCATCTALASAFALTQAQDELFRAVPAVSLDAAAASWTGAPLKVNVSEAITKAWSESCFKQPAMCYSFFRSPQLPHPIRMAIPSSIWTSVSNGAHAGAITDVAVATTMGQKRLYEAMGWEAVGGGASGAEEGADGQVGEGSGEGVGMGGAWENPFGGALMTCRGCGARSDGYVFRLSVIDAPDRLDAMHAELASSPWGPSGVRATMEVLPVPWNNTALAVYKAPFGLPPPSRARVSRGQPVAPRPLVLLRALSFDVSDMQLHSAAFQQQFSSMQIPGAFANAASGSVSDVLSDLLAFSGSGGRTHSARSGIFSVLATLKKVFAEHRVSGETVRDLFSALIADARAPGRLWASPTGTGREGTQDIVTMDSFVYERGRAVDSLLPRRYTLAALLATFGKKSPPLTPSEAALAEKKGGWTFWSRSGSTTAKPKLAPGSLAVSGTGIALMPYTHIMVTRGHGCSIRQGADPSNWRPLAVATHLPTPQRSSILGGGSSSAERRASPLTSCTTKDGSCPAELFPGSEPSVPSMRMSMSTDLQTRWDLFVGSPKEMKVDKKKEEAKEKEKERAMRERERERRRQWGTDLDEFDIDREPDYNTREAELEKQEKRLRVSTHLYPPWVDTSLDHIALEEARAAIRQTQMLREIEPQEPDRGPRGRDNRQYGGARRRRRAPGVPPLPPRPAWVAAAQEDVCRPDDISTLPSAAATLQQASPQCLGVRTVKVPPFTQAVALRAAESAAFVRRHPDWQIGAAFFICHGNIPDWVHVLVLPANKDRQLLAGGVGSGHYDIQSGGSGLAMADARGSLGFRVYEDGYDSLQGGGSVSSVLMTPADTDTFLQGVARAVRFSAGQMRSLAVSVLSNGALPGTCSAQAEAGPSALTQSGSLPLKFRDPVPSGLTVVTPSGIPPWVLGTKLSNLVGNSRRCARLQRVAQGRGGGVSSWATHLLSLSSQPQRLASLQGTLGLGSNMQTRTPPSPWAVWEGVREMLQEGCDFRLFVPVEPTRKATPGGSLGSPVVLSLDEDRGVLVEQDTPSWSEAGDLLADPLVSVVRGNGTGVERGMKSASRTHDPIVKQRLIEELTDDSLLRPSVDSFFFELRAEWVWIPKNPRRRPRVRPTKKATRQAAMARYGALLDVGYSRWADGHHTWRTDWPAPRLETELSVPPSSWDFEDEDEDEDFEVPEGVSFESEEGKVAWGGGDQFGVGESEQEEGGSSNEEGEKEGEKEETAEGGEGESGVEKPEEEVVEGEEEKAAKEEFDAAIDQISPPPPEPEEGVGVGRGFGFESGEEVRMRLEDEGAGGSGGFGLPRLFGEGYGGSGRWSVFLVQDVWVRHDGRVRVGA